MSPILIDYAITLKAIEDRKPIPETRKDLINYIGTTERTYQKLIGPDGWKCKQIAKRVWLMSLFLQCKIDDLLNPLYIEDLMQDYEIRRLLNPD